MEGFFQPYERETPFEQKKALESTVGFSWYGRKDMTGSGSFISKEGLILTAYHIAKPCIDKHAKQTKDGFVAKDIDHGLDCGETIQVIMIKEIDGKVEYSRQNSGLSLIAVPPQGGAMHLTENFHDFVNDFAILRYKPGTKNYFNLSQTPVESGIPVFQVGFPYISYRSKEGSEKFIQVLQSSIEWMKNRSENLRVGKFLSTEKLRQFYLENWRKAPIAACEFYKTRYESMLTDEKVYSDLTKLIKDSEDHIAQLTERLNEVKKDIGEKMSEKKLGYADANDQVRISFGKVFNWNQEWKNQTIPSDMDNIGGYSGSPILNSQGELMGVSYAVLEGYKGQGGRYLQNNAKGIQIRKIMQALQLEYVLSSKFEFR